MSALLHLCEAIQEFGDKATVWGRREKQAVAEVESELKISFPDSVCDFAHKFGNVNLPPFQVVITGNETYSYSCVTETYALRKRHPSVPSHYAKIMSYAGIAYCIVTAGSKIGRVISWDEDYPPIEGSLLKEFANFDDFIEWLIAESRSITSDTSFQF